MKSKSIISRVLLIFVGIIFIISAVMKLLSIDSFEIYVYSLGVLSLNSSLVISRLLIGFELILGLCLVFSIFAKYAIRLSLATLLGFTGFLFYLLFSGKEEHCHCFGDVVELSHTVSIIKNLVLCGLLIAIIRFPFKNIRSYKFFFAIICVVGLIAPFMYSIPDNFIKRESRISYQQEYLDTFLSENLHLTQGRKLAGFIGTGCRFCKLTAKKFTVISKKVNNSTDIFYVVWGNEKTLDNFFDETHSYRFNHSFLPGNIFLKITDGSLPVILLLEDGKVVKKYDYRNIKEEEIINFLR